MSPAFKKLSLSVLPVAAVALGSALTTRALMNGNGTSSGAGTDHSAAAAVTSSNPPPPAAPDHFLKIWCYDCHGDGAQKGGLTLDDAARLSPQTWENIRRHVLLHTMPPAGKPAPADTDRENFETDLMTWQASLPETLPRHVPGARARELSLTDAAIISSSSPSFPGATAAAATSLHAANASSPAAFRRLSRSEISRSLEGLLGISAAAIRADLPEDETAHGFDNNGDMQPLPPARLEAYLAAISRAVSTALLPPPVPAKTLRAMPPEFTGDGGLFPDAPSFHLTTSGRPVRVKFHTPAAGRYRWSLIAYAHQAGDGPALLQLAGSVPQPVWSHDRDVPERLETTLDLPAGDCVLSYRLTNPLTDAANPDPHRRMRRLLVRETSLDGPLEGDSTPAPHFVEILGPVPPVTASMDEKLHAADEALTKFAGLAWRRPPSLPESLRLLSLTGNSLAHGFRYDQAMAGTVEAVLASPNFLFLINPSAVPADLRNDAVAARLSYFLWSRPPDKSLSAAVHAACASPGRQEPDALAATAAAMLDDDRAEAFATDFAGQWLQLRNAALASPDQTLFPQATPALRAAMTQESTRFFLSLVRENQPVPSLLTAGHTFVNAALADFYGLPRPAGPPEEFSRADWPASQRRGLLGQASVLMLTSYPNRTSPVLRGKYLLETLLGLEPPPPPPNVPTLEPAGSRSAGPHSVRAALERHRADPGCASCHRAIDPLGFPLEAWNAIGLPAADAGNSPPTTVFTGEILTNSEDLTHWLVTVQGARIVHHTAERLLTYALGRGLSPREKLTARQLADQAGGRDARFRDLILAIVRSPVFRGEEP